MSPHTLKATEVALTPMTVLTVAAIAPAPDTDPVLEMRLCRRRAPGAGLEATAAGVRIPLAASRDVADALGAAVAAARRHEAAEAGRRRGEAAVPSRSGDAARGSTINTAD